MLLGLGTGCSGLWLTGLEFPVCWTPTPQLPEHRQRTREGQQTGPSEINHLLPPASPWEAHG